MCTQFGLFEQGKKPEKIQRLMLGSLTNAKGLWEYLTDAKRLASVVGALPEDSKNALGFVTKQNGWVEIEQLEACSEASPTAKRLMVEVFWQMAGFGRMSRPKLLLEDFASEHCYLSAELA